MAGMVTNAFERLIGQDLAIQLISRAVEQDRVAPAYLFAGVDGIGRSLAALGFLRLLTGSAAPLSHPDVAWVEPTYLHQGKRYTVAEAEVAGIKRKTVPLIRLEQVREIAQFLARKPLKAPRSVVVIEQAEAMPEAAANALLKTLEEPGQATLILLASSGEALLPTLVSRCQRIPFYRLNATAMAQVLQQVGQAEILQQPQVLALAQGSPGAAIAHWQQLQTIPSELLEQLTQIPQTTRQAMELARQIHQSLEPESQRWLLQYLQQSYWNQIWPRFHQGLQPSLPLVALEKAKDYLNRNVQPRLVWEVTLLELVKIFGRQVSASNHPGN